jgi:hypothetical protein
MARELKNQIATFKEPKSEADTTRKDGIPIEDLLKALPCTKV